MQAGAGRGYDDRNGTWGEMDDEKNWEHKQSVLKTALMTFIPAVSKDIPRELALAFC